MCRFKSRRAYYVLGLLCLSLCLRALFPMVPGSLAPSVLSVCLASPWGPPFSLLQELFLISSLFLLDPEIPSFASFKDLPAPKPHVFHQHFSGR